MEIEKTSNNLSNIGAEENKITDTNNGDDITEINETNNNSDIGLFLNTHIDKKLIMKILTIGPYQPQGLFPSHEDNKRTFSSEYYYVSTKTGQKIERRWLCYSNILNGVYCEVCWLFANRNDPNLQEAWIKGTINDWQGLSKKIKKHENCKVHFNACIAYSNFMNEKSGIVGSLQNEAEDWKTVLIIILDVLLTLVINNIPLRGHREKIKKIDSNSGNFLNIIDLLSRYDDRLKKHLENPENKIKHLSPSIQNELLELAANRVLKQITNSIRDSPFISLILDTTQDKSKSDQLSIMIRYTIVEPNKEIEIHESFLGFLQVFKFLSF